ncbi:MAG: hypothetical protein QUV05_23925 [Phycisphaerae bacterium]|jgi:hypothetical protein|nr:hypothetical protein [Phycisphaerae bacterium]
MSKWLMGLVVLAAAATAQASPPRLAPVYYSPYYPPHYYVYAPAFRGRYRPVAVYVPRPVRRAPVVYDRSVNRAAVAGTVHAIR